VKETRSCLDFTGYPAVVHVHAYPRAVGVSIAPDSDRPDQTRTATALHAVEVEDTAVAILEFASGALGVLQATTAAYLGYPRCVEITGSEGTVILERDQILAVERAQQSAQTGVDAIVTLSPSYVLRL
jgi:predicted dehydrogenase